MLLYNEIWLTSEQIILVSIREIKGELWTTSYADRIWNWNIYKPNQISYLPSQHRLWSVYSLPLSAVTYWIIHSQYFALTIQFCGEASPVLLTNLLGINSYKILFLIRLLWNPSPPGRLSSPIWFKNVAASFCWKCSQSIMLNNHLWKCWQLEESTIFK